MKYKKGKYEYEKDQILKQWIVFERHGSILDEVYRDKTKKQCDAWIENPTRKTKKKRH